MILWSTLLGDGHPFVTAYGTFVRDYMSREYSYQMRLRNLGTQAPVAAIFFRFVQLRTVHYWRRALSQRALPSAPEFGLVLEKLDLQDKSWVPDLPHKYWKPLEKPPPTAPTVPSHIVRPRIAWISCMDRESVFVLTDFPNGFTTANESRFSITKQIPKLIATCYRRTLKNRIVEIKPH